MADPDRSDTPLIGPTSSPANTPASLRFDFKRDTNWQDRYFPLWRRVLMYPASPDFGEALEISFRGSLGMLLIGFPAIFGLGTHHGIEFFIDNELFSAGTVISFVYTLDRTMGKTLRNAWYGILGTFVAAIMSGFMYLLFPDGAIDQGSIVYFFGGITGALLIVACLYLNFPLSFQVFFCSNFVWFLMAFLDPGEFWKPTELNPSELISRKRTDDSFQVSSFLGIYFKDWGGHAGGDLARMVVGALMALIVTLLPYPMSSMEHARDSAAKIVDVIGKTWRDLIHFYLDCEKDDEKRAKVEHDMKLIKGSINTLREHLDGGAWWETFLPCWRKKYIYLKKFEQTTFRCYEHLVHVVDACESEGFEDTHYEMVKGDKCGRHLKQLAYNATVLLQILVKRADAGDVKPDEKEELLHLMDELEKLEITLSVSVRRFRKEILEKKVGTISENMAVGTISENMADQEEELIKSRLDKELVDEQIFVFSLCEFASSVQYYCKWLTAEGEKDTIASLTDGFKNVVDKDTITARDNVSFTIRSALAIFIGFAVGWVGFEDGALIPGKSASIPSTAAVLMSHSLASPISKALTRLQGVVMGTIYGTIIHSLLRWCDPWAQVTLSLVVFAYVWFCLFVYHHTSSFSYMGCLAAAFGTNAFLVGCSSEATEFNPHVMVNCALAIWIKAFVETTISIARPSEIAFGAFLDAWTVSATTLEDLLSDKDTKWDDPVAELTGLLAKAEALLPEAAIEPQLWRGPFPKGLFYQMIRYARVIRTEVICIGTIVCDQELNNSKKTWFVDAITCQSSTLCREFVKVIDEMDKTYRVVKVLAEQNGKPCSSKTKKLRELSQSEMEASQFETKTSTLQLSSFNVSDSAATSKRSSKILVEDESVQATFVFGCLRKIQEISHEMQLTLVKSS